MANDRAQGSPFPLFQVSRLRWTQTRYPGEGCEADASSPPRPRLVVLKEWKLRILQANAYPKQTHTHTHTFEAPASIRAVARFAIVILLIFIHLTLVDIYNVPDLIKMLYILPCFSIHTS